MPIVKQLKRHKLLLDTHVWIWVLMGEEKLKKSFISSLEAAAANDNIYIAAISLWEIGMLVERKRIELEMDCLDWIQQALDMPGINLMPLSPQIAVQSSRLPGSFHGDPADRILVASAFESKAVLVTHDQKILAYGKDKFIHVYDPL